MWLCVCVCESVLAGRWEIYIELVHNSSNFKHMCPISYLVLIPIRVVKLFTQCTSLNYTQYTAGWLPDRNHRRLGHHWFCYWTRLTAHIMLLHNKINCRLLNLYQLGCNKSFILQWISIVWITNRSLLGIYSAYQYPRRWSSDDRDYCDWYHYIYMIYTIHNCDNVYENGNYHQNRNT